jgi:hypothetical protein
MRTRRADHTHRGGIARMRREAIGEGRADARPTATVGTATIAFLLRVYHIDIYQPFMAWG